MRLHRPMLVRLRGVVTGLNLSIRGNRCVKRRKFCRGRKVKEFICLSKGRTQAAHRLSVSGAAANRIKTNKRMSKEEKDAYPENSSA